MCNSAQTTNLSSRLLVLLPAPCPKLEIASSPKAHTDRVGNVGASQKLHFWEPTETRFEVGTHEVHHRINMLRRLGALCTRSPAGCATTSAAWTGVHHMLGAAAAQPATQLQSLAALVTGPDSLISLFSSAAAPESGFVTLNTLHDRPGATKQVRAS